MTSPFRGRSQWKGDQPQLGTPGPETLIGQMMTTHHLRRLKEEMEIFFKRGVLVRVRRMGSIPSKSMGGDMANKLKEKNHLTR
jgi:hypothetical protein